MTPRYAREAVPFQEWPKPLRDYAASLFRRAAEVGWTGSAGAFVPSIRRKAKELGLPQPVISGAHKAVWLRGGGPERALRPTPAPKAATRLHAPTSLRSVGGEALAGLGAAADLAGRVLDTPPARAALKVLAAGSGAVDETLAEAVRAGKRALGLAPAVGLKESARRALTAPFRGAWQSTEGRKVFEALGLSGGLAATLGFVLDLKNPGDKVQLLRGGLKLAEQAGSAAKALRELEQAQKVAAAVGHTRAAKALLRAAEQVKQGSQYQEALAKLEGWGIHLNPEDRAVQRRFAGLFQVARGDEGLGAERARKTAERVRQEVRALARDTGQDEAKLQEAVNKVFDVTEQAARDAGQDQARALRERRVRERLAIRAAKRRETKLQGALETRRAAARTATAKQAAGRLTEGEARAAKGQVTRIENAQARLRKERQALEAQQQALARSGQTVPLETATTVRSIPVTPEERAGYDQLIAATKQRTREQLRESFRAEGLPADQVEALAESIQREEDRLLSQMVDVGLISPERARMWEGVHLRRLYRKHEDYDTWLNELLTATPEDVERIRAEELSKATLGRPRRSGSGVPGGWRQPAQHRRELTLEEAQGSPKGFITDTAARVFQGQALAARAIARKRLYDELVRHDELWWDPPVRGAVPPRGFSQLPDSKAYGELAGKWVRTPIAVQLKGINENGMPFGRLYNTLLSVWKGSKVMNLSTLSRNVQTNFALSYLATGLNPFMPSGARAYATAAKVLREDGPFLATARRVMPDLTDTMVDREFGRFLRLGTPESGLRRAVRNALGVLNPSVDTDVNRFRRTAYAGPEVFNKVANFVYELGKRLSPDELDQVLRAGWDDEALRTAMKEGTGNRVERALIEAGKEGSAAGIDYGAAGPLTNLAARTGIMPFSRFTAGVLRHFPRRMIEEPRRPLNLYRLGRLMEGWAAQTEAEQERRRSWAPEYRRPTTLLVPGATVPVQDPPATPEAAPPPPRRVPVGLDVGHLVPTDVATGQQLTPRNLAFGNPFAATLGSLATGRDLGAFRYTDEAPPLVQPEDESPAAAYGRFLARQLLPTDLGYNLPRVISALRQEPGWDGRPRYGVEEAIGRALGVTLTPLDPVAAQEREGRSLRGDLLDLRRKLRRVGRSPGVTDDERTRALERLRRDLEQRLGAYDQWQRLQEAAP